VAGRGGMGIVYRATQLDLGRPVAVKVIAADRARDPGLRERFSLEARLAAAIDHPNLVPVHAAGEEDGRLYLVMRYVAGTDLHRALKASGRLAPARAADVVSQVAAGLDAAHAEGLVHRDVKPANVLLAGPHVYLGDFGLTRLQSSGERFTESGAWVGTVDYMSPEHLRGEPCDARSDVYALGCVLFAALTGRAPFRRETVPATMSAHLHEPAPWPSEHAPVPTAFDGVIERAMAKRPEDRYPSAGDLGRAVLAAAAGEHVTVEERTVATGAAAPAELTTAMPTEFVSEPATAWSPPEHAPALRRHHVIPRRGPLAVLFVAALSASVAAVMLVRSEPDRASAVTAELSESDVRDAVEGFSDAIAKEDAAGLSRAITRDVKRVFPGDSQSGRSAVLATYRGQFRTNRISGYEISDLDVSGGRSGRAAGTYTFSREGRDDTGGRIILGVRRERGRAKVALIAADPS
jgi:tRNA A-37 threonylcarbamoyl transferase component Bud32